MARLNSVELRNKAKRLADEEFYRFWEAVDECSEILQQISPNRRRLWLSNVIREIHREQKGLCALCGNPLDLGGHQVDHIIPFCYGGGNERANIQLAHPDCNNRKRARVDPYDLLRYLEDRYMNL